MLAALSGVPAAASGCTAIASASQPLRQRLVPDPTSWTQANSVRRRTAPESPLQTTEFWRIYHVTQNPDRCWPAYQDRAARPECQARAGGGQPLHFAFLYPLLSARGKRGHGVVIEDVDGNEFFDFSAGI